MTSQHHVRRTAEDLLAYIDASPSPFHCVAETQRRAEAAGFLRLDEAEPWDLEAGQGYVIPCDGSIILLRPGLDDMEDAGFRLIGAHTDSPNFRVKPLGDVAKSGYAQVGVQPYGGLLSHTWVDRDLGVAGRVSFREEGGVASRLVDIREPLLRIPSLAIHLDRELRDKGLHLNAQDHLQPVLGLVPEDAKSGGFRGVIAEACGVPMGAILAWDLSLFDLTPAGFGGLDDAFIFAPRLDNQAMCHAGLEALLRSSAASATQVVCLYDHEEVGSASHSAATGAFVERVLRRLAPDPETWGRATSRSWQLSADMAHALHPNYEAKHEPAHRPRMGDGPVIKVNANQRYATCDAGEALFASLCADAGVGCQRFVMRSDLPCGSTIGPLSASRLGIRTVDVGNPMLSMHSIREQCGSADAEAMVAAMTGFLDIS